MRLIPYAGAVAGLVLATALIAPVQAAESQVYGMTARLIEGRDKILEDYRGKVILIVNTASRCGFTPQYAGLESLYQKYRDRGFEILAFPSNDFGGQEPGTNQEIREFCDLRFRVTFDLFEKIHVKGSSAHPLFRYLAGESEFPGEVTWNFNKFLIGPDGRVVARFDSRVAPEAPELVASLEKTLSA